MKELFDKKEGSRFQVYTAQELGHITLALQKFSTLNLVT